MTGETRPRPPLVWILLAAVALVGVIATPYSPTESAVSIVGVALALACALCAVGAWLQHRWAAMLAIIRGVAGGGLEWLYREEYRIRVGGWGQLPYDLTWYPAFSTALIALSVALIVAGIVAFVVGGSPGTSAIESD